MASYRQIRDFLRYDVWRRTNAELTSRGKRLGYRVLRTIVLVVRGFTSKNLNVRANSLTYSLVFAIIPILAMILAVAKGFGVADLIQQQLNDSFLGETNLVPTIMAMVERYLDTAQGGVFLGVGLIILLWAVYSFFRNAESAFNEIWNVKQSRSVIRQLTTYIAIVVLIPILVVVTSGLSIFVNSTVVASLPNAAFFAQFRSGIVRLLQFVICWALFTWMYAAIPNTKVKFLSALIPGILIGTLFQLLQMLSVYIIVFLSRTSIVYGAFATLPILLTWLQWTCLLILIGAEMSFAIQNNELFEYQHDVEKMSRRYKDFITLYLLAVIIKRFEQDEPPLTAHELATHNHIPLRLVNQLLSRLVETQLLREIYIENKEDRTFQPALDTHLITIGMVFDRIDCQGTEEFLQSTPPEMQQFWQRFIQLKSEHNTLTQVRIDEI
ncbi:MAG: YihY/virulence factor BrkB family protein [Paludibacteraceae bacterium]|nr:YihY/virulence factor BrkB family protein [Bacteroidales bacterium]MDY4148828.1 YihY/virulence factor BrkB family protein [Paludibacteraceae bacterium]